MAINIFSGIRVSVIFFTTKDTKDTKELMIRLTQYAKIYLGIRLFVLSLGLQSELCSMEQRVK